MRLWSSRFFLLSLLLVSAPFAFAHDITITGTQTFASLDGSSSDHDGSANGVFTVSDGNLVVNGVVNCNDDGGNPSACPMAFAVSGNMTINSGGALYAENRSSGGSGGAITLTVGGNLALNGTAIVSSAAKTSASGVGGAITANVTGGVSLATGTTIDAGSAKDDGGAINVNAGGVVSIAGNVFSGPSRTLLATKLTGEILDGGNPNSSGGAIAIRSTTFAGPAITVTSTANVVSQGEKNGAGPVTLDGCGVNVNGLVAAVSIKDSPSVVVIRSGRSATIDGRDLSGSGTRMGIIRADALSDGADNDRVDLFARESVTILGPAGAGSLFAVSSVPGDKANKDGGGTIRIVALEGGVNASGRAIIAGVDGKKTSGGTVSISAKTDVNLDTATIVAVGDISKKGKGGHIAARSYSGNVYWRNGVGDVRPVGSTSGVPLADQGTIVLTACGTVDTTGSSYPVNGVATSMFPETHTLVCSPAAPSLPIGVVPLLACNNPPVANDTSATTNEDTAVTITMTGTDADGDTLTFTIVSGPSNGTLGPVVFVNATTSTVTYTPALNYNGADSFVFRADDGNGGTDDAMASITIFPVNDPPSFQIGATITVLEDSGPQTFANWVTAISPGPANESGQTVTFTVTTSNPALFSVQPAVSPAGTLTFTPAANMFGGASITVTAQDNGGTASGGIDTSAPQNSNINVTAVNDEPSFVKGADQTVNEDAGPQSVSGWATAISAGPNEGGQTVTFVTSNNNNSLFSVQPAVSPGGTLTYTPAADAFGTATVSVYLTDDGGILNGGDDTSPTQTFTITVNAVNDAPSFTGGGNVTVDEDSGPYSASWATAISAGPANESSQTLTFNTVSNSNPSLFSAGPTINASGVLAFTPAANAFGSATLVINLQDSGGIANGGVDTSSNYTFTITVNGVNDEPSFTAGGNVTVNEDSGPYSAVWATAISAGPNESGQTLTFFVSNTNNSLFSVQPSISSGGVLTFTPAPNAFGSATVSVYLMDNGGTAGGGDDTSPTVMFTITVNSVNDPPVVVGEAYETIGNTLLEVSASQSQSPAVFVSGTVLANDTDIDGPSSLTASFGSATVGAAVVVNPDGTFTYVPPAGFTGGTDSFTYNVSDGASSASGTVTVNVKNRVWYVRNNTSGTSGRSHDPFATLAGAESVAAAGDTIYVFTGDGTTSGQSSGFVMSSNQRLLGAGVQLDVPVSVNGGPNPTVLLAAGTRPNIGNSGGSGVTASNVSGVEIAGLNVSASTSGIRIVTTGVSSGSANVHDMGVVSAGVEGFDVDAGGVGGLLTVSVNDVTVASTGNGFDGRTTAGELRVALNGSALTSSAGSGVFLNQGAGTLLVVTSLLNDVVTGNTGGTGIAAMGVRFDAIPGGTLDTVNGGTLLIGSAGNGVGGSGLSLSATTGHLSFTNLFVEADGPAGVLVAGSGPLTAATGTGLSAASGSITATAGAALNASSATLNLTLSSLTSTNSGTVGLSLSGVSGSVSATTGSITNATNTDVSISGSSANVSYGGTITDDIGRLVDVSTSSGTIALSSAITDGDDGDGNGISLTGNTGTITFSGGVTLSTGANAAFTATGGGTVNVIDPAGPANNKVTTTTATAVNISSGTNIGGSGATFESITVSNGGSPSAANAIVLGGTTGSFTVTGDGSTTGGFLDRDGSGGTIDRTTGHAVLLTNASNVTLRQMNLTNTASGADAVNSTGGSNIVLSAVNVDTPGRHGWSVKDLGGVNRVDNNSRFFGWNTVNANAVGVDQNVSFTSFTVDRSLFTTSATGADAFLFDGNAGSGTVNVTNSEFTLIDQDAVQINNDGTGSITAVVKSNNLHDADSTGGDGNNTLFLSNTGSGLLNLTIGGPVASDGNSFTNLGRLVVLAGVVQVNATTISKTGTQLVGTIQNNTITGSTGRRAIDIGIEASGGAHGGHDVTISNNNISNMRKQGVNVLITSLSGGDVTGNKFRIVNNVLTNVGTEGATDSGSGIEFENNAANAGADFSSDVLIQNNQVSNNNNSGVGSTLEVNNRSLFAGDTNVLNLTLWGNSFTNSNAAGEVMEVLNTGTAGTQTLCLDMNGANLLANANSYTGGGAAGFKLTNNFGTFGIGFMSAGAQSFAAVQTFLSPRNNSQTVTAAGAVGNMSGSPGGCTLP